MPDFYDFLSKDPKKLSIVAIVPRGDSEKYDIPEEYKQKLDAFQLSENPEALMKEYPEMFIPTVPVYLVFNDKELVFLYSTKEELIKLFTDGNALGF